MCRIALTIALIAFTAGAMAQHVTLDWDKEFARKYALGGYAILGPKVYAFGRLSQWWSQAITGKYRFVRCGLGERKDLSASETSI